MGIAFTDCCRVRGVCCEPNRPRIEKRKSIEHIFIPYKRSANKRTKGRNKTPMLS